MYRRIHNQFGTAGMILSVVAIVLALTGGAIAASGGKPGPRGPRGKTGKTGPQGPAGPAGTNGTNGALGKEGPEGKAGKDGTNGTNGKNVTVSNSAASCFEGGISVKVEGSAEEHEVCNGEEGEKGEKGEKGDPWTAGGTLPTNATETGQWVENGGAAEEGWEEKTFHTFYMSTAISFSIPLTAPLPYFSKAQEEAEPNDVNKVHFVLPNGMELRENVQESQTACSGSVAAPAAATGNLCVYLLQSEPSSGSLEPGNAFGFKIIRNEQEEVFGAGTAGAALRFKAECGSNVTGKPTGDCEWHIGGSWAVTG